MKKIKIIVSLLALIAIAGCQKDGIDKDTSFISSSTTGTTGKVFDISNDNSGKVTITPTGEGVSSFLVKFGHGTGASAEAKVVPGYSADHNYPEGNYTVTIVSKSLSGQETTATYPLQVTYRAPEKVAINVDPQGLTLKVSATALYAASYLVYFGDVANETGTALAKGATVSHNYAAPGNYNVKVVALSGGAAKTEATKTVTVTDPFRFPINFESTTVNYFFGTFGGGQQFAKVANPNASGLNTSATVGKFTRGWEWWSGTYSPLNIPLDMSQGKKIKVLVYNPDPALVGAKLNVELESADNNNPANGVAVLKVPVTTSGVWEELVFDFSTISGIPANAKFNQLVLRFNDAADGAAGLGQIIYVDNFTQTN